MTELDLTEPAIPPESLIMVAEELLKDDGLRNPNLAHIADFFGATLGYSFVSNENNDPDDEAVLSELLLLTVNAALSYRRRFVAAARANGLN